jgi:hypothetical protein
MDANATETQPVSAPTQPVLGRVRERQSRYRVAGEIDGRTRAGCRAKELTKQFEAALGDAITDALKIEVHRAAVLTALVEDARLRRVAGDILRGGKSPLPTRSVRLDRVAAAARRNLKIDERREPEPDPWNAFPVLEVTPPLLSATPTRRSHGLAPVAECGASWRRPGAAMTTTEKRMATDERQFAISGKWALGSDGLQWIVYQQRSEKNGGWRGVLFVRSTKDILARFAGEGLPRAGYSGFACSPATLPSTNGQTRPILPYHARRTC